MECGGKHEKRKVRSTTETPQLKRKHLIKPNREHSVPKVKQWTTISDPDLSERRGGIEELGVCQKPDERHPSH